jgi:hypothetical protein
MNKDNWWLLTISSLLYIMQLPSIYFDILEIIGHWSGALSSLSYKNVKNICIKGIRVQSPLYLNPLALLRSWVQIPPPDLFLLIWENTAYFELIFGVVVEQHL